MYPANTPTKPSVREQAVKLRRELSPMNRRVMSKAICGCLEDHLVLRSARSVAGYRAVGSEASVDGFLLSIMTQRKRLYLPRTREDYSLDLCEVADLEKECVPGAHGILEPVGPAALDLTEIEVILMPGVAFDKLGRRIGSGRGYYDRLLQRLGKHVCRIGVAFQCQVFPAIPFDSWDENVDWLVTENGWHRCEEQPINVIRSTKLF